MTSTLKALIAASLIVVAVATGVVSGTLATFTAQTVNPGNVESNATLAMKNVAGTAVAGSNCSTETTNGTCATLFNVQNLLPGGSSSNTATITYTGTVPTGDFRLFMANFNEFASGYNATLCTNTHPGQQIGLQIKQGSAVIYPTSGTGFGSLYDFAVTTAYSSSSTGLRLKPGANSDSGTLGTWPAGNPAVVFTVNLQMDSAVDNTNQGCRSSFDLDWYATQNSPSGWFPKASMLLARGYGAGTSANGSFYVIGGHNGSTDDPAVQRYVPATNTWTSVTSLPGGRYQSDGATVIGGQIYLPGGWTTSPPLPNSTLFSVPVNPDGTLGAWTSLAAMPTLSACGVSGVIAGKLYVTTPCNGYSGYPSIMHVYDPLTNAWSSLTAPPTAHAYGIAAVFNGLLYVVGGLDGSGIGTGAVHAYDPVTNTWATKASMPTPRTSMASGVVNGKLYVIGGSSGSTTVGVVEVYNPTTDSWSTDLSMTSPRTAAQSAVVNGVIYVAGGYGLAGGPVTTNEAFVPAP